MMFRASKAAKEQAGFSLIELAILVTIVGVIMATALQTYKLYLHRTAMMNVLERKSNVELALGRFLATNGRMPCPTDPSLPVSDLNAGKEICTIPGVAYPTLSDPSCNTICRVEGARRVIMAAPNRDRVLRGGIPYVTLGISEKEAYDHWGSMLSYAVTEALANPAGLGVAFTENNGAIGLNAWNGTADSPTANPRVLTGAAYTPNSFMFVLLSHGADKKGGWTNQGKQPVACAGDGRDVQNCRIHGTSDLNKSVFIDASYMVAQAGAQFYDDAFVTVSLSRDFDKWQYGSVLDTISSKAGRRVAIGHQSPGADFCTLAQISAGTCPILLDVRGNVRARPVTADAGKIMAPKFCAADGTNCFGAWVVGGAGTDCNGSGTMSGIKTEKAQCIDSILADGSLDLTSCANGSYLRGYCTDGSKWCVNPNDAATHSIPPGCTINCKWGCTDWTACTAGERTRTCAVGPAGCTGEGGESPALSEACTIPPPPGGGEPATFTTAPATLVEPAAVFTGSNLALNKPSYQINIASGEGPSRANDGATDTGMYTTNIANPWWYVDLGGLANLTGIKIRNTTNVPNAAHQQWTDIDVSEDGVTWTPIYSHNGAAFAAGTWISINATGNVARFVRARLVGVRVYRLVEFEVYGTMPKVGLKGKRYVGYFSDNVNFFGTAPEHGDSNALTEIKNFGNAPAQHYSWQWTGYFKPSASGTWRFFTNSDDASFFWIGPNAVTGFTTANALVKNGGTHGLVEKSGTISLQADYYYPVRVQYGNSGGTPATNSITLSFSGPGVTKRTNGSGYFFHH